MIRQSELKIERPQIQDTYYYLAYCVLLIFNGLTYALNYQYVLLRVDLFLKSFVQQLDPQYLSMRPYQVFIYMLTAISSAIFLLHLLVPKKYNSHIQQKRFIIRFWLHFLALIFSFIICVFNIIQICIFSFTLELQLVDWRYFTVWKTSVYNALYGVQIWFGIAAIGVSIYLLVFYFKMLQFRYSTMAVKRQVSEVFNKICYFATYISLFVVLSLNIKVLEEYLDWITLQSANLQTSMEMQLWTPLSYFEYLLTGLCFLFTAFLTIKQIFDKETNIFVKRRRQLVVHFFIMGIILVLTINRLVEMKRYDKMIDDWGRPEYFMYDQFSILYRDMRKVFWCYIFLLFPLVIYSIKNKWIEWVNSFPAIKLQQNQNQQQQIGNVRSDILIHEPIRMKNQVEEDIRQERPQQQNHQNIRMNNEQLNQPLIGP